MSRIDRTLGFHGNVSAAAQGGTSDSRIGEQGEQFGEPACVGDEASKWTRCPRN